MIQLTDHMKFNKKEGPSRETLIPLRGGYKMIMVSRGRKCPWCENERGGEMERIRYEDRNERSLEGQESEWKYAGL